MVRTLILISWDGVSTPLDQIAADTVPQFEILLFDYSGSAAEPATALPIHSRLSKKTECKGQIFILFRDYLDQTSAHYDYVALIDDDITVSISALNGAIALATDADLDSFALALSADSFVNHERFIAQAGSVMREMPWVEVMMPFYRQSLYMAAGSFFADSVSSYGIDQFVMPMVCKMTGMDRVALIDAFSAGHYRPVTSDGRVYSNGLTAHQERIILRQRCIAEIKANRPDLLATPWFYQTFAPLNGPGRFWILYLNWPWHLVQRLVPARAKRHGRSRGRREQK